MADLDGGVDVPAVSLLLTVPVFLLPALLVTALFLLDM